MRAIRGPGNRRIECAHLLLHGDSALGAPPAGYGSCAVVGSSGALLADRAGLSIDENEFVFRFNEAPTIGFEPFVGSKTSLRLLNTQAMGAVLQRCDPIGTCQANVACCPRERHILLNTNSMSIASCYQSVCGGGILRSTTQLDSSAFVARTRSVLPNLGRDTRRLCWDPAARAARSGARAVHGVRIR
mgnify:CR=1 FL=1